MHIITNTGECRKALRDDLSMIGYTGILAGEELNSCNLADVHILGPLSNILLMYIGVLHIYIGSNLCEATKI